MNNWITQVNYTFVQLRTEANPAKTSVKMSDVLHSNLPERASEYNISLQRLSEIHLQSTDILYADVFKTNSKKLVYTLLLIALFILLIAVFNFINLSTAGALGRAKETGVQKVLAREELTCWRSFSVSRSYCAHFLLHWEFCW
jgi:putative ABC transport system permease protein